MQFFWLQSSSRAAEATEGHLPPMTKYRIGWHVDDDEATTEKADDAARESAEGNAFDIEDIIDVGNLDLRNTLSDKPISKPKLLPKEK